MSLLIRPIQESDFAEWLRVALWPQHTPEELAADLPGMLARWAQEPIFVAQRPDGRLGGVIEAARHETAPGCVASPVGYIEGWYVDPDLRCQGVGRQLVEAAEAWARGQGCQEMASDTTPDYPLSPLAHARLGYRETAVPYHYCKSLADGQPLAG